MHIFAYYVCIIVSFMKRFAEHHKFYKSQITAMSTEGESRVARRSTRAPSKMQNLPVAEASLRGDVWSAAGSSAPPEFIFSRCHSKLTVSISKCFDLRRVSAEFDSSSLSLFLFLPQLFTIGPSARQETSAPS